MLSLHPGRRAAPVALTLVALVLSVPSAALGSPGAASGDGVQPVEVAGNPACPNTFFERKLDTGEVADGTYTLGGFSVTVDVRNTSLGEVFDFDANMGVDQVIVKGGPNANSYVYSPEDDADTGLHAPLNDGNGKYPDISHISFCFDFELQVAKTATTTFTREYDWTIDKSNDVEGAPVQISPGQQYTVNYDVVVGLGAATDSDHAVGGTITVTNPAPIAASVTSVTDVITKPLAADIPAAVDCNGAAAGNGLPATVASLGTLTCTYSAALPDGSSRTNTATAVSGTPKINNGSGTAAVTFGAPTTEIDECVTVTDDKTDPLNPVTLGTVCQGQAPKTFEYALTFGPFANECTMHSFTNTAAFTTNDEGDTGSATSTASFAVQCVVQGGCTLTQGYWKTHSREGPAPYDESWKNLGQNEEDTLFLNTQSTWYQVFWMAPQGGNAFLILAHQYQAAVLNKLDGASVPADVATAITQAAGLLDDYTSIPAARSIPRSTRDQMVQLAGVLASYNEGSTGPGHCDEDGLSSATP